MTRSHLLVFAASIVVASSSFGQDASKKAEEARQSSEMMKPQTQAPAMTPKSMAKPMSEADRKAEEARKSSEMMKPQTAAPSRSSATPMSAPQGAADRKAAETQKKTEMMKPQ
jgi:hypothetical protein